MGEIARDDFMNTASKRWVVQQVVGVELTLNEPPFWGRARKPKCV